MPVAIILAIGVDSSLVSDRGSAWQSAGYFVRSVGTIREAIDHFRDGDFDLVLLGHSIPAESRERLTFLIRSTGSRIPVVSIADSVDRWDPFADVTVINEPSALLDGVGQMLARDSGRTFVRTVPYTTPPPNFRPVVQ